MTTTTRAQAPADHADATATPAVERRSPPPERLARIQLLAPISLVVPTYREAENLPTLMERVDALRSGHGVTLELLVMDDDSRDGSAELVASSGHEWATLVTRTENRGLSAAVVDGLRRARYPVVVCLDADLSHPPEKIPDMVMALESGQQFVIGSRYVPGGSTDDDWGLFRWLNSRVATILARPLTTARDPMSGFFAMRKSDFDAAAPLNPTGYKIALELIVKCRAENVGEVPIHFTDRVRGQSKLTLGEQLRYLQHLRRLYAYRFATAADVLRFLAVGATGLVVNLAVLWTLAGFGAPPWLALLGGVVVSLVGNALANRRFATERPRGRGGDPKLRLAGFVALTLVGGLANYLLSLWAYDALPLGTLRGRPAGVALAAVVGVAVGSVFNFLGNRFVVFKRRYTTPPRRDRAADPAPR